MGRRDAFLSTMLGFFTLLASCSRPGDPGYYEPLPDAGSGGTTSKSSDNSGATPPQPSSEPPASSDPAAGGVGGGVSSEGGGGSTAAEREPEPEPAPDLPAPDYDPAVILDDGVLHVWTLGDSITVGVSGGFRNDIYNLLTADGYDVDLVGTLQDDSAEIDDQDHEGHTAYTFALAREDVDGWLAQIHRPDVVLMLLGANDFAWWTNQEPPEHLLVMMDLVDHLVELLPGAAVVVATLTPQSSEIVEDVHRDRQEMVEEFDDLLRAELPQHPEYGKHVFMADLGAHITLADLYDGIHPTREAHREIGGLWYQVLQEILPSP